MRDVVLVAQGDHVGRVEPRIFAQPRDQEGAALADERRVALRFLPGSRQAFFGNEPGIVVAGVRNDAQAVRADEYRSAACRPPGVVDRLQHAPGGLPACLGFPHAAGDQQHRFHGIGPDHLVDDAEGDVGGHREDQQVQFLLQRSQVQRAAHAIDFLAVGIDDAQPRLVITGCDDVLQGDPAEVHARGRGADDSDRSRVQQLVDLALRPRRADLLRAADAAQSVECDKRAGRAGEGVDLQLLDDEVGLGVAGRAVVGEADEGAKALQERFVRHQPAASPRLSGDPPVGNRRSENFEEFLGRGQRGRGRHHRLPATGAAGMELGVDAANSGAEDHAELARVVDADQEFAAGARGVRFDELREHHPRDVPS